MKFESGIQVLVCPNCRSDTWLKIGDDQIHCPDCSASYPVIDGVLDLMPAGYSGYQGDSLEEAILRDAHNRKTLRADSANLRSWPESGFPQGRW